MDCDIATLNMLFCHQHKKTLHNGTIDAASPRGRHDATARAKFRIKEKETDRRLDVHSLH